MNIMELTEIDWGGRHTGEGGTPYSIYYTSLFIYSFYMPRVLMIKEQISFIAHKENEQLDFASFVLLSVSSFKLIEDLSDCGFMCVCVVRENVTFVVFLDQYILNGKSVLRKHSRTSLRPTTRFQAGPWDLCVVRSKLGGGFYVACNWPIAQVTKATFLSFKSNSIQVFAFIADGLNFFFPQHSYTKTSSLCLNHY